MPVQHIHQFPAVALFEATEDRSTLLARFEDFLSQHEAVSDFVFDDSDDSGTHLSVMFQIQLSFGADECYEDMENPTEETIAKRENEFEELAFGKFQVLSISILEDAGFHLDTFGE